MCIDCLKKKLKLKNNQPKIRSAVSTQPEMFVFKKIVTETKGWSKLYNFVCADSGCPIVNDTSSSHPAPTCGQESIVSPTYLVTSTITKNDWV